jgi:hypothetical protein
MTRIQYGSHRPGRGERAGARRPRRGVALGRCEPLEHRNLLTIIGLTGNVSPAILRPINPRNQPHAVQVAVIRPVTLAGYVTQVGDDLPIVSFRVVDQHGHDQPNATLITQRAQPGTTYYSSRFGLSLRRRHGEHDGPRYTVIVTARDLQNSRTVSIPVPSLPIGPHHPPRARVGRHPTN